MRKRGSLALGLLPFTPVFITLMMSLTLVLPSRASSAESLYEITTKQAFEAYEAKDYERAAKMFELASKECTRIGKDSRVKVIVLNGLAVSYFKCNQPAKAQETASEALAICVGAMTVDDPLFLKTKQNYEQVLAKTPATINTELNAGSDSAQRAAQPKESDTNQAADLKAESPKAVDAAVTSNQNQNAIPGEEEHAKTVSGRKTKSLCKSLLKRSAFWNANYYFVGQNSKNCEIFFGTVRHNWVVGGATVDFKMPSNGCSCHGTTKITYIPPTLSLSNAGQEGTVSVKCTDGRSMHGEFRTASLTTGQGQISDTLGNSYKFTFGHTAEQAAQGVNVTRKKLGCASCGAKDVTREVASSHQSAQ